MDFLEVIVRCVIPELQHDLPIVHRYINGRGHVKDCLMVQMPAVMLVNYDVEMKLRMVQNTVMSISDVTMIPVHGNNLPVHWMAYRRH